MPREKPFMHSSKLLQKKWEDKQYKVHQDKINSIKPSIDNSPPKRYPHLENRRKKLQLQEERQAEIDHENEILLSKMASIMHTRGSVDNWNDYSSKSLNKGKRERRQEKIAEENAEITKRLHQVEPNYDIHEWGEDFLLHEYYLEMWASSTKDYRTPRDSHGKPGDEYESDFEDDDSVKLPRIDSAEGSGKRKKNKKESSVTKLPKLATPRNTGGDDDIKQLFKVCTKQARGNDVLVKTLVKKSHSQRMHTKRTFEESYDMDLCAKLKAAMGKDYHILIECLLTERENTDAEAINKAIHNNKPSELVKIFFARKSSAMASVNKAYRKSYEISIEEDITERLLDETSKDLLLTILKGKRPEEGSVDEGMAQDEAEELYNGNKGQWTKKDGAFMTLLKTRSLPQIKSTFFKYKKLAVGKSVATAVKKDGCSDDFTTSVEAIEQSLAKGPDNIADEIKGYMRMAKQKEVIDILLVRSEIDMPEIRKAYKKNHGNELLDDIIARFDLVGPLIAQIAAKQPAASHNAKSKNSRIINGMVIEGPQQKTTVKKPTGRRDETLTKESPFAASNKSSQQKKGDQSKEKKTTQGTVTPAKNFKVDDDVKKIHKAMKGWGTNEKPLIDILSQRSNDQRQQIKKKYKEVHKKDLDKELESELTGDFEELILALMMPPTEYDAYCLHDAISGPGTREAALIGILCSRNAGEIRAIKSAYKKQYKTDLLKDIKGDTSGEFEKVLEELVRGGRQPGDKVDKKQVEVDAKLIYVEIEKDGGHIVGVDTKGDIFREIMTQRSKMHLKAIFDHFLKSIQVSIEEAIQNSLSGDEADAYVALVKAIQDPVEFYAVRLNDSMAGLGTNEKQLIRIIVSRSEIDLVQIKAKYKTLYKKKLEESIESDCSGDYKKLLLALIKGQGQK